ncbi:MAG TPA: hypothetical protein VD995_21030 [Azospirillum sp.]|nr:hypothetical protein [Azospirillum sp.]
MAQILMFPTPAEAPQRAMEPAVADMDPDKAEALAVFDRLMAFHAETQRQMADVMTLGGQAMAERPEAEVVYYPVLRAAQG